MKLIRKMESFCFFFISKRLFAVESATLERFHKLCCHLKGNKNKFSKRLLPLLTEQLYFGCFLTCFLCISTSRKKNKKKKQHRTKPKKARFFLFFAKCEMSFSASFTSHFHFNFKCNRQHKTVVKSSSGSNLV